MTCTPQRRRSRSETSPSASPRARRTSSPSAASRSTSRTTSSSPSSARPAAARARCSTSLAGLRRRPRARRWSTAKPVDGPGPERGVIFQQYALFPWLTVRQNVEFGLRIARARRPSARRDPEHYHRPGRPRSKFADALPKTLSGGMKQRCAIARAYAVNPTILLMDEPFGALDALTRVQLQDQLLDTWSQERRTVIFITHDVDEAVYPRQPGGRHGRPARPDPRDHRRGSALSADRGDAARPRVRRLRNRVWNAVYHQHRRLTADLPPRASPEETAPTMTIAKACEAPRRRRRRRGPRHQPAACGGSATTPAATAQGQLRLHRRLQRHQPAGRRQQAGPVGEARPRRRHQGVHQRPDADPGARRRRPRLRLHRPRRHVAAGLRQGQDRLDEHPRPRRPGHRAGRHRLDQGSQGQEGRRARGHLRRHDPQPRAREGRA